MSRGAAAKRRRWSRKRRKRGGGGRRNARGGGFMRSGGEEIIGIHMRTEGGRPKPYSTRSAASNGGGIKGLASRG